MKPIRFLLLNACFVAVVVAACAQQLNFWARMGAILFLGLYLPTVLLMQLIPERDDDHEYPVKLRLLLWPMLMLGWVVSAVALAGVIWPQP